jgi:hypothetical protein
MNSGAIPEYRDVNMGVDHNEIKKLFLKDAFIISNHARVRMFQRNISTDDIKSVIEYGEIIEDYPDDEPCSAALFLGFTNQRPCHVVIAQCEDHARVITVYIPEKDKWVDYRIRRD